MLEPEGWGFPLNGLAAELETGGYSPFCDQPVARGAALWVKMAALAAPYISISLERFGYGDAGAPWWEFHARDEVARVQLPVGLTDARQAVPMFVERVNAAFEAHNGRRFVVFRLAPYRFRIAFCAADALRRHPSLDLLHVVDVDRMEAGDGEVLALPSVESLVGAERVYRQDVECITGGESYGPLLQHLVGDEFELERFSHEETEELPASLRERPPRFPIPGRRKDCHIQLSFNAGGRRYQTVVRGQTDVFDGHVITLLNDALRDVGSSRRIAMLESFDQSFALARATRAETAELERLAYLREGSRNPWHDESASKPD